jgi:predicted AAA+ superfamily ATPase
MNFENVFKPKWVEFKRYTKETEAQNVESLFVRENIRYKLIANTRETRMACSVMHKGIGKSSLVGVMGDYAADSNTSVYIFRVHRDDIERAARIACSGV